MRASRWPAILTWKIPLFRGNFRVGRLADRAPRQVCQFVLVTFDELGGAVLLERPPIFAGSLGAVALESPEDRFPCKVEPAIGRRVGEQGSDLLRRPSGEPAADLGDLELQVGATLGISDEQPHVSLDLLQSDLAIGSPHRDTARRDGVGIAVWTHPEAVACSMLLVRHFGGSAAVNPHFV